MKLQKSTLFLVFMLILCSLVFLYPAVSSYWNAQHQSSVISTYQDTMQEIEGEDYSDIFAAAQTYNETLASLPKHKYENGEPVDPAYASLLKLDDIDVMGYISIDKINVKLPIYHGTSEATLAAGTGHLEGSSLPIGGESTHTVITGHRGLASATLFTDLDELKRGDLFTLSVLSETLTYKVDQILIVPPEEVDAVSIIPGEDYCTLVTCTPFGINTDRMLVRGTRVENVEELELDLKITSEARLIDPMVVSVFIIVPLISIFMLLIFCMPTPTKKR